MRNLIVLTGVRGAGKSTLLASLSKHDVVQVLQPSTDRKPRVDEFEEYEFLDTWPSDMAWTINVGAHKYGMRDSQLNALGVGKVGVTVFDPGNLQVCFDKLLGRPGFDILLVGLDTVGNIDEQRSRVANDSARSMAEAEFDRQVAEIRRLSDIVFSGNAETVLRAFRSILELLGSRGGVLIERDLKALISAGALLSNADEGQVQPASYDLRLFNKIWCRGQYIQLDDANPTAKIPPHSFVVVQAFEEARLPRFVVGRFDLKVSLFFSGVILSNGPQVDPGYRGSLFCMLFNSSDVAVGLTRNQHFATIEFCTTSRVAPGYSNQYSGKSGFEQFLTSQTAISPGGNLLQRIDDGDDAVRKELADRLQGTDRYMLIAVGVVFVVVISLLMFAYTTYTELTKAVTEAKNSVVETTKLRIELEKSISDLGDQIREGKAWLATNGRPLSDKSDLSPTKQTSDEMRSNQFRDKASSQSARKSTSERNEPRP